VKIILKINKRNRMKTKNRILKLISGILVMLLFTTAGYSNSPDITERVKSTVNNEMHFPEYAKEKGINGVAVVKYTVEIDGSIKINEISATDKSLEKHIINRINKVKIKDINHKSMDEEIVSKFIFKSKDSERN